MLAKLTTVEYIWNIHEALARDFHDTFRIIHFLYTEQKKKKKETLHAYMLTCFLPYISAKEHYFQILLHISVTCQTSRGLSATVFYVHFRQKWVLYTIGISIKFSISKAA